MRARWLLPWLGLAACVGAQDQPSNVHDLRVLGVAVDPPDVMAVPPRDGGADTGFKLCDLNSIFAVVGRQLTYSALIADPDGGARTLQFDLLACGNQSDTTCSNSWESVVLVDGGTTSAANGLDDVLTLNITPGTLTTDGQPPAIGFLPDGGLYSNALLFQVEQDDPYHGLGGLLMPLVLHLRGEPVPGMGGALEEIYAQKLMVYSCAFFPDMKPNVTPQLRGFQLDGIEWPEDAVPKRVGAGPFHVVADDISDLEESYSVVDFNLNELQLKESWKIDYYASKGTFSPDETGGVDLAGNADPHSTGWTPEAGQEAGRVHFWFTVRDGRGGFSWVTRELDYVPD